MAGRVTVHGTEEDPVELRERATRMTLETLADDPARSMGAIKRIAEGLGLPRGPSCVGASGRGAPATRPGTITTDAGRIKELEKEVREPCRPTRSWRAPWLFSRRGSTARPVALQLREIQEGRVRGRADLCHADKFLCQDRPVDRLHGQVRPPPPRARRDEVLKDEICTLHAENYSTLGVRKMHVVLNRPLVAERHGRRRCPLHGGAPHALGGAVGPRRPTRRAPHCVSSAPRTWRTATSRLGSLMSCGSPTSPTSERSRSGRTSLSS